MFIRILVAASLVVSAVVHYRLWDDGYRDIDTVGPLFMLNAVSGIVIAVAVLAWRHWLPLLAAIGFGASTLIAFSLSTTSNGFMDVHESWSGTNELVGAASEALAVVLGAFAILQERKKSEIG